MAPAPDPDASAKSSRLPAVILIVASDDRERAELLRHLLRRYREDYDVQAEGSTATALELLKSLSDDGRELAIMLVERQLPDGEGIELLSEAQTSHPEAMRALLVSR